MLMKMNMDTKWVQRSKWSEKVLQLNNLICFDPFILTRIDAKWKASWISTLEHNRYTRYELQGFPNLFISDLGYTIPHWYCLRNAVACESVSFETVLEMTKSSPEVSSKLLFNLDIFNF